MIKDELPDDLVEFLESDRRLEYDASACEIGVFTFRTLDEIEEIRGIRCKVVGDFLTGAAGGLPHGPAIAPRIWVREGDSGRAREIIEEWADRPPEDWVEILEDDELDEDEED